MNKRQIGNEYELLAIEYLEGLGYTILDRNYRCKIGEVDIVAKDGDYICFIEVKYRKSNKYGYPIESITQYKQLTIIKVARFYLMAKGFGEGAKIRFDVVLILDSELNLVKNAFGGI